MAYWDSFDDGAPVNPLKFPGNFLPIHLPEGQLLADYSRAAERTPNQHRGPADRGKREDVCTESALYAYDSAL